MGNIAVTEEMLDNIERRAVFALAGLEVGDAGTLYKYNAQTGESEVARRPPELPSGRELLAQLLQEGRRMGERPVQVAREAALCELLLAQHAKEEGNK